ncbi:hypothetical protein FHX74_000728 [Friedmanniella endophytica]|uniref:DUF3618 domain-containing protein n=1 Tax=Microlunatus kandeliicorticis TaxID=1759536 RepID=A0A7W3IQ26_9ACTN|nr:DUF3618 domain-containing protein [Microlunatus kandeliicorticis]MBA8793134.1 hypothetical protein [Microlunatus kandeliicorticis]
MSAEAKRNADRLEARMESTREHLADSIGALADKADLKGQAGHLVDDAAMKAEHAAAEAKIKAAEARDLAAAQASHLRSRAGELSPALVAVLVAAPVVALVLFRRLRRR